MERHAKILILVHEQHQEPRPNAPANIRFLRRRRTARAVRGHPEVDKTMLPELTFVF